MVKVMLNGIWMTAMGLLLWTGVTPAGGAPSGGALPPSLPPAATSLPPAIASLPAPYRAPFLPAREDERLQEVPPAADPNVLEMRSLRAKLDTAPRDLDAAIRLANSYIDYSRQIGDAPAMPITPGTRRRSLLRGRVLRLHPPMHYLPRRPSCSTAISSTPPVSFSERRCISTHATPRRGSRRLRSTWFRGITKQPARTAPK
jgi:hypothetical protein